MSRMRQAPQAGPGDSRIIEEHDLAGPHDEDEIEAKDDRERRWYRLRPKPRRHRHTHHDELYVLLEGRGRVRVGDELVTCEPLSALYVEAETVRQVFNDTDADALWLVVGAPPEAANTLEMTPQQLRQLYPDGPQALPPELT